MTPSTACRHSHKKIILLNLQGKNNNEVAEELNISVNTVKSLKKSAYMTLRSGNTWAKNISGC